MSDKKKFPKIMTPIGVAMYPWLTKPDTKFNAEGVYKVTLRLPKDEATEKLVTTLEKHFQEANASRKSKREGTRCWDTDEETGEVLIKFKSKKKPALFDAQGKTITKDLAVFGGSKVRIQGAIGTYDVATTGAGVTLYLNAVQIIDLQEGGSPFGAVEGGFEFSGEEAPTDVVQETTAGQAEDNY